MTVLLACIGIVLFTAYLLWLIFREEEWRLEEPKDYTPPALRRDWLDR